MKVTYAKALSMELNLVGVTVQDVINYLGSIIPTEILLFVDNKPVKSSYIISPDNRLVELREKRKRPKFCHQEGNRILIYIH
jgi:hypothetical protein